MRVPHQLAVVGERLRITWPKKLRCCTHMKSDSRSVSAITTMFSGFADAFSASGAAVTPAGGPFGKCAGRVAGDARGDDELAARLEAVAQRARVAHHR